jgi:hypothetical protein
VEVDVATAVLVELALELELFDPGLTSAYPSRDGCVQICTRKRVCDQVQRATALDSAEPPLPSSGE